MKFILVLISFVFLVLVSSHEIQSLKASDLADSSGNVEVADSEVLRLGRAAEKKQPKKKKINKRNKSKERNNGKKIGSKRKIQTQKEKKSKKGKKATKKKTNKKRKKEGKKNPGRNAKKNTEKKELNKKQGQKGKKANHKMENKTKNKKEKKKKEKNEKRKKKKGKKNRNNSNEKLFCCCNKATGDKICKKDTKICLPGFVVCDKPPTPTPVPAPTPAPSICPPTTPCPPTCEAELVQKMKDLKKVTNWIKQWKRLTTFLKRVSNKKSKSDSFVNASIALGSATMNGTMCAGMGPDTEANDAWNILKNCQTNVEADCMCSVTAPNNTCETDLQNIFNSITNCTNVASDQICTCFAAIPSPNPICNIATELAAATTCNKDCQATWSKCSTALKEAAPLVDRCKCDCVKPTTNSPAGRRLFLNLRNFHQIH